MSDKNLSRRTDIEIQFDGVDISDSIRKNLISMTYIDSEDDESDDLEIRLEDRNQIWLEKWLDSTIDAAASSGNQNQNASGDIYTVTPKIGLNIRKGPGTDFQKIGAFPYGSKVTVLSVTNGWAKIQYNNQDAYVAANYLKQSETDTKTGDAETGISIRAAILRQNWNGDGIDDRLDCGQFTLDSVDADGPPSRIVFRAAAFNLQSPIREIYRSKRWEDYDLYGVANEIAGKNNMILSFLSDYNPRYKWREQNKQSDIAFLSRLCKDAGLSLKITDGAIVIFDAAQFEKKDPALTIRRGGGIYINYQLHIGGANTQYQSCRVSYNDPKTGSKIESVAKIPDYDEESENNRQLEITASVESVAEAKALAEKRLRMANRYAKTATFTMPGNPILLSGVIIRLEDFGPWNGNYIIYQARHEISGNGYKTNINIRRCLDGY